MLKYIILTLSMLSPSLWARPATQNIIPLPACGGQIEVERSDLQALIKVKDVVHCPYVVIEVERQSLQLAADGRYELLYVWHEAPTPDGLLHIMLHTASGEVRDAVTVAGSARGTGEKSRPSLVSSL